MLRYTFDRLYCFFLSFCRVTISDYLQKERLRFEKIVIIAEYLFMNINYDFYTKNDICKNKYIIINFFFKESVSFNIIRTHTADVLI